MLPLNKEIVFIECVIHGRKITENGEQSEFCGGSPSILDINGCKKLWCTKNLTDSNIYLVQL